MTHKQRRKLCAQRLVQVQLEMRQSSACACASATPQRRRRQDLLHITITVHCSGVAQGDCAGARAPLQDQGLISNANAKAHANAHASCAPPEPGKHQQFA